MIKDRCEVEPNTGCLLWSGAVNGKGYGRVYWNGKIERAHRVAYIEAYGAIPPGLHVLHRCDTPACCNPDHLFLGTNRDNVQDAMTKGRRYVPKGELNGKAVLNRVAVLRIRESQLNGRQLASEYGVHEATISVIRSGKTWKN